MSPIPALLLAVALAPLAWMFWGRSRPASGPRYRRLAATQWRRFGLPAIALLGVTGQWRAFVALPSAFDPARAWLGVEDFGPSDRLVMAGACAGGVALGAAVLLLLTAWRAWRGRGDGTLFGDARALIPTDPRDFGWAAAVAITAGLTEEAYFRLLLPLLAAQAFGSTAVGFVGATLLFGAAHRYQGWRGVAATTVAGGGMAVAYLATTSLPLVMAVHAGGDLVHFVARPVVRRWVERMKSRR